LSASVMWHVAGEKKHKQNQAQPQCPATTDPLPKNQNFSVHMVFIKLGLKQFIIPLRCNFTNHLQSGVHLLPLQEVWVTNTPPFLGLRFPLFTHASHWSCECFLCTSAALVLHMLVRKHQTFTHTDHGGVCPHAHCTVCCHSSCPQCLVGKVHLRRGGKISNFWL